MKRGTFGFETTDKGGLLNAAANVQALRRLWLDRTLIQGEDLGPGDSGDFDNGAWHVSCHVVAAGGVMRASDGRLLWLEVSHDPQVDSYVATATVKSGTAAQTLRLDSPAVRAPLEGAALLGFVEGNSVGRISARGVNDPPTLFNLWRRQDFDQPRGTAADGGKVWEHWCTLRDIRPSSGIGASVLSAYVALVAALGDRFVPAVVRGRRDYGHPQQLRAMVIAGLVGQEAALWDTTPVVIPASAERLLLEAEPAKALEAVGQLAWDNPPRYYMFSRRIASWSATAAVREDFRGI
jgi:hypothetical protein